VRALAPLQVQGNFQVSANRMGVHAMFGIMANTRLARNLIVECSDADG
jgi:hypothetical protein